MPRPHYRPPVGVTDARAQGVYSERRDTDWKKITSAEKWPVGVTAHHVAGAHDPIENIVKTIAAGESLPHVTMIVLDEMNAQHAREYAHCTMAETLALHNSRAARAAAPLGGLSDAELAHSGAPGEQSGRIHMNARLADAKEAAFRRSC